MIEKIINREISIGIEKMYIELTQRCNLNCKHCYNSSGGNSKEDIPFENVKELVMFCKKEGLISIALSGGEALLHPEIDKIMDFINEQNISIYLLTNGTILDKDKVGLLLKYMPEIQISLDGPDEESNDAIRGHGAYKRTIEFIKLLKSMNYGNKININTVLNKYNINNYDEIIDVAKNLGVKYVSFSILTFAGRAADNDLEIDHKVSQTAINHINDELQFKRDIFCKGLQVGHRCSMNFARDNKIYVQPKITAKGDVFPCQMHNDPIFNLGNIYDQPINNIISGEKTRNYLLLSQLRKKFISSCINCRFDVFCEKGCLAKAYSDNKNIFSQDGSCRYYKKEFINALSQKEAAL